MWIFAALLLSAPAMALAADVGAVPRSDPPGFTMSEPAREFDADSLYEYINGHAEYYLGAGFEGLSVGEYGAGEDGQPKLVESCTYPLTGLAVVSRIYTDLAVIDVTPAGFQVVELAPGVDHDYVAERTGATLLRMPETAGADAS